MATILEKYEKKFGRHKELFYEAQKNFPDGITTNSRHTIPFPIYIKEAHGAKKWGVDGSSFIDYWAGHGALLRGHNPSSVTQAVQTQIQKGTHYGACHELEIEWGSLVKDLIPSAERLRFTGSGTEAVLLSIQLARKYTKKNKILRFANHYHGWSQTMLQHDNCEVTVCPQINDINIVKKILQTDNDIAAVILEPTGASSGVVPVNKKFLQQLRQCTLEYGILLIFDEVVTGFRVSGGGAQLHCQTLPDLTVLAKILAGGLPGGAVAGKKEILDLISIEKSMQYKTPSIPHFGTFNANPLSASAGIAMLKSIKTAPPYEQINRNAQKLRDGLNDIIDQHCLDWAVYGEFSCIKFFIGHGNKQIRAADFQPYDWDQEQLCARGNSELRNILRLGLLINEVDISLSSFMTTAHSEKDIQQTILAFDQVIGWMLKDKVI